jgi:hypothetical protein
LYICFIVDLMCIIHCLLDENFDTKKKRKIFNKF